MVANSSSWRATELISFTCAASTLTRACGGSIRSVLQPCLLGGVDLIRRWGRMGTIGGSTLTETYPDEASAQAALEKLAARKRRRGYA
jgi:hypothetical protein